MKKMLIAGITALGLGASIQAISLKDLVQLKNLGQLINLVDSIGKQLVVVEASINTIPTNIQTIKAKNKELVEKIEAISELFTNLNAISKPLADAVTTINQNPLGSKLLPRQFVNGIVKLNSAIQEAAGAI